MKTQREISIWWNHDDAEWFQIESYAGEEELPADYVEVTWTLGDLDDEWWLKAKAWSGMDAFWAYDESESNDWPNTRDRKDHYVAALLAHPGAVPEEVALQGKSKDWTPFEDGSER